MLLTLFFVLAGAAVASAAHALFAFAAVLDGSSSTILGEACARDDGTLELVPHQRQAVSPSSSSPSSVTLFGRGIGTWRRRESGVYEACAQLYAYTTAQQPDEPSELLFLCVVDAEHAIRGAIFTADAERQQIGTVCATPLESRHQLTRAIREVAPSAYSYAQLPPLGRELLRASRRPTPPPPTEAAQRSEELAATLAAHRVGSLDAVHYFPDFVSEAEEAEIAAQLASSPSAMWHSMAGRRVQECGTTLSADGSGLLVEQLPPWMVAMRERLVAMGLFPAALTPNSVALNEYTREQGIAPHSDGPIYAPRVAILSLFSPAVLRFYGAQPELPEQTEWSEETDTPRHTPRGDPVESVLLRPRSLLLFSHAAYREHCHEVAAAPDGFEVLGAAGELTNGHLARAREGEVIERGERRVSLTIRHVLEFLLAPSAFVDEAPA